MTTSWQVFLKHTDGKSHTINFTKPREVSARNVVFAAEQMWAVCTERGDRLWPLIYIVVIILKNRQDNSFLCLIHYLVSKRYCFLMQRLLAVGFCVCVCAFPYIMARHIQSDIHSWKATKTGSTSTLKAICMSYVQQRNDKERKKGCLVSLTMLVRTAFRSSSCSCNYSILHVCFVNLITPFYWACERK